MRKNRLHAILSVILILVLLSTFSLSSCALQDRSKPIFQDQANAIATELDALIASKANALETDASSYEASGDVLKDENGNDLDMSAYIAQLRERASILRTLTYRPYTLAIMDDLYAREYIGVYRSVRSLLPAMVDILAENILLDRLTDEEITTDELITCYILALGDIYASYVDTETATKEYEMPTSYVGIGVSVTPRDDGYIDVISVTKGSPAEEGAILPGDVLVAVEGEDIANIDYNQVVALVRGEVDTSITLTFSRDGVPYTVTLVRRVVENVTVEYKMLSLGEGTTGYIRISEFSAGTFGEFVTAVEALEKLGAKEFVFDVRSNPGGNAEVVIAILEYILPNDITLPIVRFDSRDGSESFHSVEEYLASYSADAETLAKFDKAKNHELSARIAVLCNEFTASAGELFTSCLMDFGIAETYGVTTYGKGLGQSSFRVSDYYAYAELGVQYYTQFEMGYFVIPSFYYSPPISPNYHDKGVVPHHELILSEEAQDYYISAIPEELDNQLAAAVGFVQGEEPYTPPPTSGSMQSPGTPPSGSENEHTPSSPTETEKEGFFSSNTFIFIIFGILFAGVSLLVAYLVADYRRAAKQQKDAFSSWDDPKNDN